MWCFCPLSGVVVSLVEAGRNEEGAERAKKGTCEHTFFSSFCVMEARYRNYFLPFAGAAQSRDILRRAKCLTLLCRFFLFFFFIFVVAVPKVRKVH